MDNELIKLITNEEGKQLVSARELHEFLEINTRFDKWFIRMCEYGFSESNDFIRVAQKCPTPGGMQTIIDYAITIDMAKELSMIQRTDKGKQARQYFIECEKKLRESNNKPQLTLEQELVWNLYNGGIDAITAHKQLLELETKELNKTIETQGETIKEQKPFVDIALERIAKGECLSLTDINTGMNIVRGRLTKWAKEKGYLHKTQTEVNELGRKYFKVYINGKYKSIGVTKEGIKLINNNLEEIRNFGAKKNKGDKKIKF